MHRCIDKCRDRQIDREVNKQLHMMYLYIYIYMYMDRYMLIVFLAEYPLSRLRSGFLDWALEPDGRILMLRWSFGAPSQNVGELLSS